jgi:hypothetical protein
MKQVCSYNLFNSTKLHEYMNDKGLTKDSHNPHEDEEEPETTKNSTLNEIFASEIQKSGIAAVPIPIGTLELEREDYYNNDIGSNPRFITNRGCIRLEDKEISMIQIIQLN